VRGHPLEVRRVASYEEARACHILYVSRSEEERLPRLFAALEGHPVLTVSDVDAFATRGGIIRFLTVGNKVRLRINPEVGREAGLQISARLLRLAEIARSSDRR
jgi:hypothetical protein